MIILCWGWEGSEGWGRSGSTTVRWRSRGFKVARLNYSNAGLNINWNFNRIFEPGVDCYQNGERENAALRGLLCDREVQAMRMWGGMVLLC